MKISASYSRKLSHSLYGGMDYETSDHWCSAEKEVPDHLNEKDAKEEAAKLAKFCQMHVLERVAGEITSLAGGITGKEWRDLLDTYIETGKWGTGDQYERLSPMQKQVVQEIKRHHKRINYNGRSSNAK